MNKSPMESVGVADAADVTFVPYGDIAATNVQDAIEELDDEKLAIAANLSDVADAATSFDNIKQAATDIYAGVQENATDAETVTGTATDRTVTPANVTAKMSSPGPIGDIVPDEGTFTDLKTVDETTVAYTLEIASNSDGTPLTADRKLTIDVVNGPRDLNIPADQQFPATAGTVEASHLISVDANRDLATIRNLTLDGTLTVPGYLESPADSGEVVVWDMPVTAGLAVGIPVSGSFRLDATTVLKIYAESDGAGGIQNASVKFPYAALPNASDGSALGSTALMWSDLFLASGGVINFDNGNVTITHSAGQVALVGDLTTTGTVSANTAEDTDSDTDDVLVTTIPDTVYGTLIVRESTGTEACQYLLAGGTIEKVSTDATFTVTKDNASTYNVYFEDNVIKIQNKVGDNKNIRCGFFGV